MDIQVKGKQAIVLVERKIDLSNTKELKEELLELLEQGVTHVILNFQNAEMIDSSGLGKILLFQKRLKESGGNLKIININSDYISKMFKMIHLDKVIDIEE